MDNNTGVQCAMQAIVERLLSLEPQTGTLRALPSLYALRRRQSLRRVLCHQSKCVTLQASLARDNCPEQT